MRDELDARGLHVLPGAVDAHVHFNEPGRADWEGWASGTAALAAGGATACVEMPLNAHPPTLDGAAFDAKVAAAEGAAVVDFALWGGLVPAATSTGSTSWPSAASSASRRSCATRGSRTSRRRTTTCSARACGAPPRSGCRSRSTPSAPTA